MPSHTPSERAKRLSSGKARMILRDGRVRGKKLTRKQKRFMGAIASGKARFKG